MSDENYGLPAVSLGAASMPLLGFGTWPISDADVTGAVETALETGYRHLDTATGYGNEAGIGRALASAAGCRATRSSSPPSCRRRPQARSARPSRRA